MSVLMLASCVGGMRTNKLPVNIGFRPVIGHDTRAQESVPFPEDRTFRLWAQEGRTGNLYLNDETIKYNDGKWLASKAWPEDELAFEACWPMDIPVTYSKSEGIQINNFDCTSGDIDILIARARDDYEIDSLVTLGFDHILSRVDFRMLHSLSSEMSVRLTGIEVIGFAQTGDYNTRNSQKWSSADYTGSRVVYNTAVGEPIAIQSGKAIYIGEDFYAIPQECTARVKVDYEVRYGQGTWIPQTSYIETLKSDWEPSKHYTYTLNLQMDKLTCTPAISTWSNKE